MRTRPSRPAAVFLALLVTLLWSTSFILVKNGLREIPPLTFAGLRYALAAACLAPLALRRPVARGLRALTFRGWGGLAESSIINGTMLIQVAILAWLFLDESLTLSQVLGMG
ncbi:MAG TPA: EamA family transporter [Anaerolineales bacterium]|nr:EamA family transporter [Anaerolineales bacterium]